MILQLLLFLFASSQAANFTVYVGGTNPADPGWSYLRYFPASLAVSPGDSVDFVVIGYDYHTITFVPDDSPNPGSFLPLSNGTLASGELVSPFPPNSSFPILISSAITNYISSGVLAPGSLWTILIQAPAGTVLNYWCVLHPFMKGSITVVSSPSNITYNATSDMSSLDAEVDSLYITKALNNTTPSYRANFNSTGRIYTVRMVGDYSLMVSYLRFIPANFTITIGDSVEFVNDDLQDHIVAFNTSYDTIPNFTIGNLYNPTVTNASGNATDYSGGFVSSGLLSPVSVSYPYQGLGVPQPSFWSITFGAPGIYYYNCPIHFSLGMIGAINVTSSLAC